jgi:peptidoglycan hydrolase CwlO-like protein
MTLTISAAVRGDYLRAGQPAATRESRIRDMQAQRKSNLRTLKADVVGKNAALRGHRDRTEQSVIQLASRLRGLEAMVGHADETEAERDSRVQRLISRGLLEADFTEEDYAAAMQKLHSEIREAGEELSRLHEDLYELNYAVLASDSYTIQRVEQLTELIEQIARAADERALLDMVIDFKRQFLSDEENDMKELLLEARDLLTKQSLELRPEDGSRIVQQSLDRLNAQIARLNAAIAQHIGAHPDDTLLVDETL